jgi:hypothetical protein
VRFYCVQTNPEALAGYVLHNRRFLPRNRSAWRRHPHWRGTGLGLQPVYAAYWAQEGYYADSNNSIHPRRPSSHLRIPVLYIYTSVGPVHNAQVCYIPPARSFPFSTSVLYPVDPSPVLPIFHSGSVPRPESGEVTFFLSFNYCTARPETQGKELSSFTVTAAAALVAVNRRISSIRLDDGTDDTLSHPSTYI